MRVPYSCACAAIWFLSENYWKKFSFPLMTLNYFFGSSYRRFSRHGGSNHGPSTLIVGMTRRHWHRAWTFTIDIDCWHGRSALTLRTSTLTIDIDWLRASTLATVSFNIEHFNIEHCNIEHRHWPSTLIINIDNQHWPSTFTIYIDHRHWLISLAVWRM